MVKEYLLVYGCYGYTGRLIVDEALKKNLQPILAGRNAQKVEEMAKEYKLAFRAFDLADAADVEKNLAGVKVLLHCAGPFKFTAKAMADACIKTKTHYLDITGEIEVFEAIALLDKPAKDAGIVLMPGVGFDVVPSDCLALYLKEKMPIADNLELALMQVGGKISQGTAITVAENLGEGCVVRRKGKLVKIKAAELTRSIDLGDKERVAVAIPWGDVATAYRSTQIPNITVYNFLPPSVIGSMRMTNTFAPLLRLSIVKKFLTNRIKKRPAGPDAEMRGTARTTIWGEVRNNLGVTKRARLDLPEGYTLTAITAVAIAKSFMEGNTAIGYKTPAQVFGSNYILDTVPEAKRVEM